MGWTRVESRAIVCIANHAEASKRPTNSSFVSWYVTGTASTPLRNGERV